MSIQQAPRFLNIFQRHLLQVLLLNLMQMLDMQRIQIEQDKSWQKKIQKLSTSYRDQLAEVSNKNIAILIELLWQFSMQSIAKLETLESSIESSKDNKVSKKLKSLQKVHRRLVRPCFCWLCVKNTSSATFWHEWGKHSFKSCPPQLIHLCTNKTALLVQLHSSCSCN